MTDNIDKIRKAVEKINAEKATEQELDLEPLDIDKLIDNYETAHLEDLFKDD